MREYWRVTVERVRESDEDERGNVRERFEQVYQQHVNILDVGAVIDAANVSEVIEQPRQFEPALAFGE